MPLTLCALAPWVTSCHASLSRNGRGRGEAVVIGKAVVNDGIFEARVSVR